MAVVPDTVFQPYKAPAPMPADQNPHMPDFWDSVFNSFSRENDVANALEYVQRKQNQPDPNFTPDKLAGALKSRGLWDDSEHYVGAQSMADVEDITQRLAKERAAAIVRQRAGWMGWSTDLAAGLFSPTTLMPMGGEGGTILRAAGEVGLRSAAAAGIQEAVLEANQLDRGQDQMRWSLGSSFLMGSVLGGLAHGLAPKEIEKMSSDMANKPGTLAVQPPVPLGTLSSAFADPGTDAGKLASEAWNKPILDKMSNLNAVTRSIQQPGAPTMFLKVGEEGEPMQAIRLESPTLRQAGAKFSQSGLKLEGNIGDEITRDFTSYDPELGKDITKPVTEYNASSAAPGGNVQDQQMTYMGPLIGANQGMWDAYKAYATGGKGDGIIGDIKAGLTSYTSRQMMSYPEFREAVSMARATGNDGGNPHIAAAVESFKKHSDFLYQDGIDSGVYTGKEKLPGGDEAWVMHDWDGDKIAARTNDFVRDISKVETDRLEREWTSRVEKMNVKLEKKQAEHGLQTLSEAKANSLREIYTMLQDELEKNTPEEILKANEALDKAKKARKALGDVPQGTQLDKDGNVLPVDPKYAAADKAVNEAASVPGLNQYRIQRNQYRKNMALLNKTNQVQDKGYQTLLERIDRNAEAQSGEIVKASKTLSKLRDSIGTEKEWQEGRKSFLEKFKRTKERVLKNQKYLRSNVGKKDPQFAEKMEKQSKLVKRFAAIEDRLKELATTTYGKRAEKINDIMAELGRTHAEINAARVERQQRLFARAEKKSPEALKARSDALLSDIKNLPKDLIGKFMENHVGINVDPKTMKVDWGNYVHNKATELAAMMMGVNRRLAYNDLIKEARGVELSRMLAVSYKDFHPYMENDAAEILKTATRTLSADSSLRRVFGSASMEDTFQQLKEERFAHLEQAKNAVDKKGNPLSVKDREKLEKQINAFYNNGEADLHVLQSRIRGTRVMETTPSSAAQRIGDVAMELNAMRYLGGVVVASIADPGRIVQRHSLTSTFKDAFIPLITQFKDLKMSQIDAEISGVLGDTLGHSRLQQWSDVTDNVTRGSKPEKFISYLSSKMGMITGLNQWDKMIKTLSANVVNGKMMTYIGMLNGEKASQAELRQATDWLAQRNVTPEIAKNIWDVSRAGGATRIGRVWLPNTAKWDVSTQLGRDTVRAYRAAVAGEVANTVPMPGINLPNWMDGSLEGRLIGQFKSFGMVSTQKIVMAGLQEHDMAYVNGALISLALGALSYYLYSTAVGGSTRDKMLKSIQDGDWRKWADEAISRSGQTAMFDFAQRASSHIGGLSKWTTFSGGPITKQNGNGLMSDIFGPSYDLGKSATALVAGARNFDTQELHTARTLAPYQNVFYFRQLLDTIENATSDTLGLKGKRR